MFLKPLLPTALFREVRHLGLYATVALTVFALPCGARAASADRQEPVDVNANTIDGSLADDGESVLSGAVRITQGSLQVQSETARVTRSGGDLQKVLLEGAPATLEQVDDKGQPVKASAHQIIYQPDSETIELLGGVVIVQPQGNLTGERVTYHLGTGRILAGGEGGRVSMRMNPKATKTESGAQ